MVVWSHGDVVSQMTLKRGGVWGYSEGILDLRWMGKERGERMRRKATRVEW